MIQKTKDYSQFKLRTDNRAAINQSHLKRLLESIQQRNLLEYRPIIYNAQMEILDGQHRYLAAQKLGIEIWYEVKEELKSEDIIILNNSKAWGIADYLNYYCKNGHANYLKMQEFCTKNNLHLKVALDIMHGKSDKNYYAFKNGSFKFEDGDLTNYITECWNTIDILKRLNGFSYYTQSCRFWRALMKLVKSEGFRIDKWLKNVEQMPDRFGARATQQDYLKLLQQVYNWRNENKITIFEET